MFKKPFFIVSVVILLLTGCSEEVEKLKSQNTELKLQNSKLNINLTNSINTIKSLKREISILKAKIDTYKSELNTNKITNKELFKLKQKIAILEMKIEKYKEKINKDKEILKREYTNEFKEELVKSIRHTEMQKAYYIIAISIILLLALAVLFYVLYKNKITMLNSQVNSIKDKFNNEIENYKKDCAKNIDHYQQKLSSLEEKSSKDMDEIYKRSLLEEKFNNKLNEIDNAISNCIDRR